MSEEQHKALCREFPALVETVYNLTTAGHTRDRAWLIAGAILAYTGIASIPSSITDACGVNRKDYPKVVGQINEVLRGSVGATDEHRNLLALFEDMKDLPDWNAGRSDPTRMMDSYEDLEEHYSEGSVLIMGEVGSVSRDGPAPGLTDRTYRLHFQGGLKDISRINPQQKEVLYVPGSAYLVERRRTGKVKHKHGGQAHRHIYLRHVKPESPEYQRAVREGKLVDLRAKPFRS